MRIIYSIAGFLPIGIDMREPTDAATRNRFQIGTMAVQHVVIILSIEG